MKQSQGVTNQAVASAIVTYQNKILLLQRDNNPNIKEQGKWQLPGGGIEENESSDSAIKRELQEEISITPQTVRLLGEPLPKTYVYHVPLTNIEASRVVKGKEGFDLKFFTLQEALQIPLTQKLRIALETHPKLFESLLE